MNGLLSETEAHIDRKDWQKAVDCLKKAMSVDRQNKDCMRLLQKIMASQQSPLTIALSSSEPVEKRIAACNALQEADTLDKELLQSNAVPRLLDEITRLLESAKRMDLALKLIQVLLKGKVDSSKQFYKYFKKTENFFNLFLYPNNQQVFSSQLSLVSKYACLLQEQYKTNEMLLELLETLNFMNLDLDSINVVCIAVIQTIQEFPSTIELLISKFELLKELLVQSDYFKFILNVFCDKKKKFPTEIKQIDSKSLKFATALLSTEYKSNIMNSEFLDQLLEMLNSDRFSIEIMQFLIELSQEKSGRALIYSNSIMELTRQFSISNSDSQIKVLAMSVMINIMFSGEFESEPLTLLHEKSDFLTNQIIKNTSLEALDALVFMCFDSKVKQDLAENADLMQKLVELSKNSKFQYSIARLLGLVTNYPKKYSKEEQELMKLQGSVVETEDKKLVDARCKSLLKNNACVALGLLTTSSFSKVLDLVAKAFLNLANIVEMRGLIVQQALPGLTLLTSKASESGMLDAAQAVAKLAISMDPRIAFPGQRAIKLIKPLLKLCRQEKQLGQFEGLMALTNFASVSELRTEIYKQNGLNAIENLQISDNELVTRAATEALCNMIYEPRVFEYFCNNQTRLRLMLALCDAHDFNTRRAALGAFAVLSNDPKVCKLLQDSKHLLEECSKEDEQLRIRVEEIFKNCQENQVFI